MLTADTLGDLQAAVGEGAWLDAREDLSAYTVDFRQLYRGVTPLVLLPSSVDQVSRVLAICNRARVGIVPQGGNTGYCGGATPGRVRLADRPVDAQAQPRAPDRCRQPLSHRGGRLHAR